MGEDRMNADGLLRMKEVLKLCSICKSHLYTMMRCHGFPQPLKMGRSPRWLRAEVELYLQLLASGRQPVPVTTAAPITTAVPIPQPQETPRRRKLAARDATIWAAFSRGAPVRDICREHAVYPSTVYRIVGRYTEKLTRSPQAA